MINQTAQKTKPNPTLKNASSYKNVDELDANDFELPTIDLLSFKITDVKKDDENISLEIEVSSSFTKSVTRKYTTSLSIYSIYRNIYKKYVSEVEKQLRNHLNNLNDQNKSVWNNDDQYINEINLILDHKYNDDYLKLPQDFNIRGTEITFNFKRWNNGWCIIPIKLTVKRGTFSKTFDFELRYFFKLMVKNTLHN